MTTEDKRQHTRLSRGYHVKARKFSFPMTHHAFSEITCLDISAGGICVECSDPFQKGDQLQVRIHVPRLNKFKPGFFKYYENDTEQYVNAIMEVAWVEPKGFRHSMGLRFVDIDSDVEKALTDLIRKTIWDKERKEG